MKGFGYALEKRWDMMTEEQRAVMLQGIVHDADRMSCAAAATMVSSATAPLCARRAHSNRHTVAAAARLSDSALAGVRHPHRRVRHRQDLGGQSVSLVAEHERDRPARGRPVQVLVAVAVHGEDCGTRGRARPAIASAVSSPRTIGRWKIEPAEERTVFGL